jgi:hypothetical protein
MELDQGAYYANEFAQHYATVSTSLESGSNAKLAVRLVIANPFPFGPDNLLDESFDIFDETTPNHPTEASRVEFDYAQGFPFHAYVKHGASQGDAQVAHDNCLAVQPADGSLTPPGSVKDFAEEVKANAKNALYPCHIHMCSVESPGSYYGHLQTCEWNHTTGHMDCVQTNQQCETCSEQTADLCDAAGNVYHPKTISHPGLPCQIK